MSHIVIARKYRPFEFDQVIYQDHIVNTLKSGIRNERIAHAYLFSGPRGVGKTSLARIYASALNCEQGPTEKPCGVCDSCREIAAGNNMDVIEIDGASNNSVENVRNLRESARFAPIKGRYKIYIIDEVHMLTQAAFNALLKTLEEPPEHVLFIFATTELHKVPATIVSRCQKFHFKRIPYGRIVENLKHVVNQEKLQAEDKALFWIAKQSGGSMRDAQSILEQVIAYSLQGGAESIDLASVQELLGIAGLDLYMEIMRLMREQKSQQLLYTLRRNLDSGLDSGRMVQGFLEFLRVLLLTLHGVQDANVLELPEDEVEEIANLKQNFTSGEIHYLFETFRSLPNEFRYVADERILLEVTFLRALEEIQRPDIGQIIEKLADELYPQRQDSREALPSDLSQDGPKQKNSSATETTSVTKPTPPEEEVSQQDASEESLALTSNQSSVVTEESAGNVEGDSGSEGSPSEGSPVDEFVDMLKEVFDGREISSEERQNTQRLVKNMRGQSG